MCLGQFGNGAFLRNVVHHPTMGKIIFDDKMPHHTMMAVYNNVDVVLDSYFFGGDTTTREAFEVGAPVITLPHKYLGTRCSLLLIITLTRTES